MTSDPPSAREAYGRRAVTFGGCRAHVESPARAGAAFDPSRDGTATAAEAAAGTRRAPAGVAGDAARRARRPSAIEVYAS